MTTSKINLALTGTLTNREKLPIIEGMMKTHPENMKELIQIHSETLNLALMDELIEEQEEMLNEMPFTSYSKEYAQNELLKSQVTQAE